MYPPESVAASVERANHLRDRIVHQGVRVGRDDASDALAAVDFALGQALSLRDVEPPPATDSWRRRFKNVSPEVEQFVASNRVRLVVAYPDRGLFFQMELLEDDLWVRFAENIDELMATALMVTEWDTWTRRRQTDRPHLAANPVTPWPAGLVTMLTEHVQAAVCEAEALLVAARTDPAVAQVAEYAARRIVADAAGQRTFDPNDARVTMVPAKIASYLSVLDPPARDAILQPLLATQAEVARRAKMWAESLARLDPDDPHARCAALRDIHTECWWLDTIRVVCPVERMVFGSSRQALD
jgi:hypothetical protein